MTEQKGSKQRRRDPQVWMAAQMKMKTPQISSLSEMFQNSVSCWSYTSYTHLFLVSTKGVALGKLRPRVSDCSFPSLVESSVLPEPVKGQNPLDLEPLPPIFSYSTLFPWETGQPGVLQLDCKTKGDLHDKEPLKKIHINGTVRPISNVTH